ncbi:MAG: GNAT family N-acetyltransferase [Proteocatella sp.]
MEINLKKFKDLSVQELYEILRVRESVFILDQKCFYHDIDCKDMNAHHLFMQDENKVIAYLRILDKGVSYDEISIGRVMVDKEYRGNGLARKIMQNAIDFVVHNMNESKIRISAQEYLLDFYKSLGFKAETEVYMEDDIPHIEMIYSAHGGK